MGVCFPLLSACRYVSGCLRKRLPVHFRSIGCSGLKRYRCEAACGLVCVRDPACRPSLGAARNFSRLHLASPDALLRAISPSLRR